MFAIQKISLLGFSLHDGLGRSPDSLLESQRRVAIRKRPSIIQYFSFCLSFFVGPTCESTRLTGCLSSFLTNFDTKPFPKVHYLDFVEFVEGTNYSRHIATDSVERPSPTVRVFNNVC